MLTHIINYKLVYGILHNDDFYKFQFETLQREQMRPIGEVGTYYIFFKQTVEYLYFWVIFFYQKKNSFLNVELGQSVICTFEDGKFYRARVTAIKNVLEIEVSECFCQLI